VNFEFTDETTQAALASALRRMADAVEAGRPLAAIVVVGFEVEGESDAINWRSTVNVSTTRPSHALLDDLECTALDEIDSMRASVEQLATAPEA
jgi:hypothetical protein